MCITGSEIMLSEIAQHEDLGTTLDKVHILEHFNIEIFLVPKPNGGVNTMLGKDLQYCIQPTNYMCTIKISGSSSCEALIFPPMIAAAAVRRSSSLGALQ